MPRTTPGNVDPILREVQDLESDEEPKRCFIYCGQMWEVDAVDTHNRNLRVDSGTPFIAGYDPENPTDHIMLKAFLIEAWV